MKALNAFVLVLFFSGLAHADYFFCELQVGYLPKIKSVAEYRVLEASVTARPFTCSGRVIPGTQDIEVTMQSTETVQKEVAVGNGTTSIETEGLDTHGDGLEYGLCTCGME